MKKNLLLLFCLSIFIIAAVGCSDNPADNESQAHLSITAFDAPPPEGIEHLYLNIIEISAHHDENGWLTLTDIDTTIDFLELVNGVTVNLFDDSIAAGFYSQIRLVVSDTNFIVVDSVSYPLTIPSGTQTGVKLNLHEEIAAGEFLSLMIDFDISKSVIVANGEYKLKPTYNLFKENISGTILGTVADTLGSPIENALVEAAGSSYTTSTLTDNNGMYLFILPIDTYDLTASLDSTSITDTTYIGVVLNASDSLFGYDFIIE